MHKLCRIDIKRSEKIKKKLEGFIQTLKKDKRINDVYLHGSFANDDFNEGSDIDLVIVGDFKERFVDRISKILKMTDLPIEPLCYTPEEFKVMLKEKNPFIMSVIKGKKFTTR